MDDGEAQLQLSSSTDEAQTEPSTRRKTAAAVFTAVLIIDAGVFGQTIEL